MSERRFFLNGLFALSLGVLTVAGCFKAVPEGFPKTTPLTVKVVDGGKGIEGVQVTLNNTDPQAIGAISGTTDSSGVAKITTTYKNYTANGAPEGEYKVCCIKDPVVDHWKTDAEMAQMSMAERSEYYAEWEAKCAELPREIPKELGLFDQTPLKSTVSAGTAEVTFDVSEYK